MSTETQEMSEAKLVAYLSRAGLQKILEAQAAGEVSADRALALVEWWGEFVETFKLPLALRAAQMRKIILSGQKRFPDVPLLQRIFEMAQIPKVCSHCDGEGSRPCWKCDGAGGFSAGSPPLGYVGPWQSWHLCDLCYGRGGDP